MTIQRALERISRTFPDLGSVEIIEELDLSQKRLSDGTYNLQGIGQLSDIDSNVGWTLPNGFIELIDILLYDADDNPLYMGDYGYKHEILNGKFFIYTTDSTPITKLDDSIDTAYIVYYKIPDTITSTSDSFSLDSRFHDGILAGAYETLYMSYPLHKLSMVMLCRRLVLQWRGCGRINLKK